jgi:hypothetical protein
LYFETASDYRSALKTAIDMNGVTITDEQFEQMFPKVEEFLIWLRDLK